MTDARSSPGSAALAEELIKWVEQYAAKICPPGCLPLPAQEREINLFARITVALRGVAQPSPGTDELWRAYCTPDGRANCEAWAIDKRCPDCPVSPAERK